MTPGRRFRQLLAEAKDEPLALPSVFDAFSAKLVEKAGFSACSFGSSPVSHAQLGMPDAGYLTLNDMAFALERAAQVCDLPMLVDVDNGYGTALNVMRTVRTLERAGAAGIMIEDQDYHPRTPQTGTACVVSPAEAAGKIRAAVDARADENFFILARTDALAAEGLDRAIARLNEYAAAGADGVFLISRLPLAESARVAREVDVPHRMWIGDGRGGVTLRDVRAQGFDMMPLGGGDLLRAAGEGMMNFLTDLKARGLDASWDFHQRLKSTPLGDWWNFNGMDRFQALEREYLPPEVIGSRYVESSPAETKER